MVAPYRGYHGYPGVTCEDVGAQQRSVLPELIQLAAGRIGVLPRQSDLHPPPSLASRSSGNIHKHGRLGGEDTVSGLNHYIRRRTSWRLVRQKNMTFPFQIRLQETITRDPEALIVLERAAEG